MGRSKRTRESATDASTKSEITESDDLMAAKKPSVAASTYEREENTLVETPHTNENENDTGHLFADLSDALNAFQVRFEHNEDAYAFTRSISDAMARLTRVREVLDEFHAAAHQIVNAVEADVEAMAFGLCNETTALADVVETSEKKVVDAKSWISQLHQFTNVETAPM